MHRKYGLLVAVVLLTVGLDQGSKLLALSLLAERAVPLVGGFAALELRFNPGIGWGIGADAGPAVARGLLPVIGAIVGLVLLWLHHRLGETERLLRVGVALIVGGGLGNLVDRVRLGEVVDFVALQVAPAGLSVSGTFNVADVALALGVVIVGVGVLRRRGEAPEGEEEGSE